MDVARVKNRQRVDIKLLAIAIFVLLACLVYPIYYSFQYFDSGFTLNSRWVVIEVTLCSDYPEFCEGQEPKIRVGDRITQIGEFTFEDFESNRNLSLYGSTPPGGSIAIVFVRNGNQYTILWEIPPQSIFEQIESLVAPILVFGPFWLAGTVILMFMWPHSSQWRLLVLMNYLTAFWLATGVYSNYRVLYSSILLHAVSWLLLPVYLHLHLIVPGPITKRSLKNALAALYGGAVLLAFLELAQILPQFAYAISIMVIAFGSIGLLAYRILSRHTSPSDKVAARLMVAGIGLAFGPGIMIWLLPTLLELSTPGVLATSIALLALPMLPLFYTYAVFKRRLGVFEVRLNRLLTIYSLFFVYLLILSLALLFGGSIPTLGDQVFSFYLLVILAVILAVMPLQEQFRRRVNKLAYGIEFDPDDLYHVYASEIPAAVDRDSLVYILADEIIPSLGIHQSALFIYEGTGYVPIYERGIAFDHPSYSETDLVTLISRSGVYHPPDIDETLEQAREFAWVRLTLTLERRTETIGLWLFGKRDPDDFYAQKDIELLSSLAKQVAVAIDNMRLIETVQTELVERERAEEALKSYADRLQLMREIDQAVLEVSSPQEIAQAALGRLRKLIPFTRGSVIYYEPAASEAELLAVSGQAQDKLGVELRIPLDLFTMREDIENGVVWMMDDIRLLPEDSPFTQTLRVEGIRAVMAAPLMASGELIGSLNLGSNKAAGFDLEHYDIAKEVANSLAIAIHSARLLETVTGYSDELKRLSTRLINIQEEERKHISYELHDEIGQVLTAIIYNLATVRRDMPDSILMNTEDRLSDTEDLVRQVMDRIRSMSLQLRPSMLQDLGLIPTLRWYINQYGNRMNADVEFKTKNFEAQLPEAIETTLYRFVQEALTNAARHASAEKITVSLADDGGIIRAIVEDDGIGFDPEGAFLFQSSLSGTGLLGIRERVSALGGHVEIEAAIGQGTKLIAEIPLTE
ncbi:MAG: GAF domain-containing protein [Candidatus Promineifilaceae bacterium]